MVDEDIKRKILARRAAFVAAVSIAAACEPAESPPPMVCLSQSIDYPDTGAAQTDGADAEPAPDAAKDAGADATADADANAPPDAGKRDAGPPPDAGSRPHPCLSPRPTVCLSMIDID